MEHTRALSTLGLFILVAVASGCSRAQATEAHDDADAGADYGHHDAPGRGHADVKSHAPSGASTSTLRAPNLNGPPSPSAPAASPTHGASSSDSSHGSDEKRAKFVIPFTWDASEDEPLARMRGFMRSALADNAKYVTEHKPDFFKGFANGQKPRATLVTCSDSRVQSTAFDATPENDVFTIRNIGNQMMTSEGSVEYGVHHLKTPLLFIMGHSGCGAVKAALGDYSRESSPIVRELSTLKIPKGEGKPEEQLTQGVIANVHAQVALAVLKFGEEIEKGDLTVVGAVYDFRDDMHNGAGKFTIVNVNGNSEAPRIEAFTRAMTPAGLLAAKPAAPASAGDPKDAKAKSKEEKAH